MDSPETGLIKAVEKAQIIAHNTTIFKGFINIIKATIISSIPIIGSKKIACSLEKPITSIYEIHASSLLKAKYPWPKKVKKIPILKSKNMVVLLLR